MVCSDLALTGQIVPVKSDSVCVAVSVCVPVRWGGHMFSGRERETERCALRRMKARNRDGKSKQVKESVCTLFISH